MHKRRNDAVRIDFEVFRVELFLGGKVDQVSREAQPLFRHAQADLLAAGRMIRVVQFEHNLEPCF